LLCAVGGLLDNPSALARLLNDILAIRASELAVLNWGKHR
jgi:hypothetical protein